MLIAAGFSSPAAATSCSASDPVLYVFWVNARGVTAGIHLMASCFS